ncbi:hypothetical protein [Streptomyces sp. NBC_00557]|uniref:hypothetical protein n=1 Tax=Streptomyces sp. NBC_00557 TaxID=2975776 RepID=UPI002E811976|nr:hypothetical protein [Streptomyces sp. NBC_00557]WUC36350.1 hypothetical protein OG956_20075 [Streptomyces sp. NBC_00557]
MNGPATAAQWLAAGGIGAGTSAVLLGLLKAALDQGELPDYHATRKPPRPQVPPMPTRAPQRRPRHAAPPALAETQPLRQVRPQLARHTKEAA